MQKTLFVCRFTETPLQCQELTSVFRKETDLSRAERTLTMSSEGILQHSPPGSVVRYIWTEVGDSLETSISGVFYLLGSRDTDYHLLIYELDTYPHIGQLRCYTMPLYTQLLYAGCVSTFLFGFYTPIAARCSLVLWNRYKARNQLDWYLLFTHIAYVLLVTAPAMQGVLEAPNAWARSSVFVDALWMVSVMISDLFISYRAYIVWGKNLYVALLPAALVLGNFGKSSRHVLTVMILSLLQMSSVPDPMTKDNIQAYYVGLALSVKRFVIVTLVTNLICTGLISFRIWNVRRKVPASQRASNDSVSGLLSLLIESAAIYTAILIIHIVAISLESFTLIFIFTTIQTPVIGIVFSSIIVSVAQGSAFGNTSAATFNQASAERRVAWPGGSRSNPATNTGRIPTTEISMQTVISTHRDNDIETEAEAECAKEFVDLGNSVAFHRDSNMMVHFQS
ncbi:hypothetical protein D9757_006591 [Collybiopsis confluens]|uniref:Transmembrane protein n=1 Tax=Collybiopsis confluens TaxID=2823264 RepID=A0A8H5MBG0_9AGAR|nr:hypothetical protein D9757_006591 [Collybiopsis confluens]